MPPLVLALLLAATPPAPGPEPAHRAGDWPARSSGKTVTLVENPTLDDALRKIAEAAGWNLVANTGRLGEEEIVVTLRGAPVEEALEAVLSGTPLVATRHGNTVTIAPGEATAGAPKVLTGFDKPSGKRFSGDFDDAPVEEALRQVAEAGSLSLVFPPGLGGGVSGHFRDAPVEEALRAILSQAGLVGRREGEVLVVERAGGPSLVIRGGKRGLTFSIDGTKDEAVDHEIGKRLRKAERKAARAAQGEHHKGGDRVLHGDQVIGAGERAGEVVLLSGNVRLSPGSTADEVTAVGGSVDVGPGASVLGDAVAVGGDLHVAPGGRIRGDAVSIGGKIVIDDGGEVDGEQTSVNVPGLGSVLSLFGSSPHAVHESHLWKLGSALGEFAVLFLLALLMHVVAPRRVDAVAGALAVAPVKAVLTGILGTLAVPVVALLLVVTVVGIPFVAVLALGLAAVWVLGFAALAMFIGRSLPFRFERGAPVLQIALGTAALVAVGAIPVLGALCFVAAWLFLFGVVLRTRFGQPPSAPPPVHATTAPPGGLTPASPGGPSPSA
ncbi:MAG TPA: hypothetical protein VMG32_04050 [Anaeromyxobacteraceae bacterium]|nr:hypothetical protein [Anaeromyxobacteraceae bacterium]